MESTDMSAPGPGLCGSDREVFARVWRRVMPVDTYGSPVQLIGEEEPQHLCDTEGVGPLPWHPEPPVQPVPPTPVSCLGPASAPHGAQLQDFILHELADCKCYLALGRRAANQGRRTLQSIAQDEQRHARRLSAAYFLISGVRYWPQDCAPAQVSGPLPACLRKRFEEEQAGEAAYHQAAANTLDPCLRELYQELAADENSHMWLLRGLLEGM